MEAEIEYLERRAEIEVDLVQRAASYPAVRAHDELSKADLDRLAALTQPPEPHG